MSRCPAYTACMVMTVDVPEKILRDAASNGITVEQQLLRLAQAGREPDLVGLVPLNPGQRDPEAAADRIQEFASRHTLGGLKIRDIVDEGRKY